MRSLFILTAAVLALTACASQSTAPAKPAEAAKPAVAAKVPQCYSGDHGKFFNVGEKATLAGVDVVCEKTSDGKSGQWMGKKH
ncbi:hypothetical protein [Propionivibrio limicola]|uniref:hypothetical protein n=1 Tax=Propionivibrio limicola TaxID=167645 RepID=UPI00129239A8|nr:hypothetical protein [Propionivibrio limicola]